MSGSSSSANSGGQTPAKTTTDHIWDLAKVVIGAAVLAMLVKFGLLTPEQAKQAIPLIVSAKPDERDDKTKPSVEIASDHGGVTITASPPEPVAAFGPDDLEKWLPAVEKLFALLKPIVVPEPKPDPKPEPQPTPLPGPTPNEQKLLDQIKALQDAVDKLTKPPTPVIVDPKPAPTPTPETAKIVVTDEQGKPITSATIDADIQFQVSSSLSPMNCGWSKSVNGSVKVTTVYDKWHPMPDGTLPVIGYVCNLKEGSWVEFHLTDFATRQSSVLRITCNHGAQPPPDKIPDVVIKPQPDTVQPTGIAVDALRKYGAGMAEMFSAAADQNDQDATSQQIFDTMHETWNHALPKEAFQQLLTVLKSFNTPDSATAGQKASAKQQRGATLRAWAAQLKPVPGASARGDTSVLDKLIQDMEADQARNKAKWGK